MKLRYLWAVVLLGGMLACGAGEKKGEGDSAVAESDSAQADAEESDAASTPAPDSIPMTVTITIPTVQEPAGTFHGGTFRGEGKGARCEHLTDGPMEWAVLYAGTDDSLGVGPIQLSVGRLEGGKTGHISVLAQAGTVEAAGMPPMPLSHVISTAPPGGPAPGTATSGSGSATVTRDGQRVRFEVDGVSGTTKKPFRMTLVCEREGKWV